MAFFRLVRFPNLVIVALTQYLLFYRIIVPALDREHIPTALDFDEFSLFIFVTVLITAGGYIINDLVDLRIDRINKPDRVIIGKRIAHSTAYWLYFCINLTGFFLATYLAFVAERMQLLFVFPVAVVGLLLYSVILKKRPLSGNVLVSLYCAGVAGIVWLAEQPAIAKLPRDETSRVLQLLSFYAAFAFISTMFREIVKDIEDAHGDAVLKARTAPILWGDGVAKKLAAAMAISLIALLGLAAFLLRVHIVPFGNVMIGLIVVLTGVALFMLARAKEKVDYHWLSQFAKLIMLGGILLILFFE